MKTTSFLFMLLFLAACTATPKINVVDSMGIKMELSESARVLTSVALSPDGKYELSTTLRGNNIRIWDISEGKQVNLITGHGLLRRAEFSPDGKYIISGGGGDSIIQMKGTVILWDSSTGREIKQWPGTVGNSVAFSPDGSKVLSDGYSGTEAVIKVWEIKTGNQIMTLHKSPPVNNARFSPDGKYILGRGKEGNVSLWDAESGNLLRQFPHYKWVTVVDISPDGKYALSGGHEGTIKLWDIATGEEIRAWEPHHWYGLCHDVTTARFSPDGGYILSAGCDQNLKLWEVSTGKQIRQFTGHGRGRVASDTGLRAVFSPSGKYAVSGGADATLRIWDVTTGEELAMMVGFDNGEWLVITREGYYNSSEKGAQYLTVKADNKDYTVDQFYDVFYRPDVVSAKLRGEDIKDLITITMKEAIKSPPPTVDVVPLKDTDSPKIKVCYSARTTGGGIGEVRLFHNGKLIQSDGYYREVARSTTDKTKLASLNSKAIYEDMRSVSIKGKIDSVPVSVKPKGDVFEDCKDIDAVPGDNEISVTAFNSSNTVQSYMKTINFNSKIKTEDPHLYILAIGIDQYKDNNVNLKYAVKDAKDLEEKLRVQSATLYRPENIHYLLLTDREATKPSIVTKVNELSNTIKPQDSFILFVAGHGVLLQNQYYMLTHDYDGMVNDNSMISSNEIVEVSKKIKSLSQLFIFDTCHAGGVDAIVSGLYDARMSVLAKKMGLHIYASADDKQAAMDGYKGNGLFTYTLLDGLNNNREADNNKDGKVTVVGLGEYSKKKTTDISKEIGRTQTPLIINFGKDSPIYKLQ
ncbi:MAG TPA: caspase family protein [Syntrophales bacterium]|nr:caspase family protein [Syntrophales bacterium]